MQCFLIWEFVANLGNVVFFFENNEIGDTGNNVLPGAGRQSIKFTISHIYQHRKPNKFQRQYFCISFLLVWEFVANLGNAVFFFEMK